MIITCVICFSDWTFADKESMETLGELVDFFVSILSWAWILLAKLAWIFLTNKRVYGEALWMDGLFWQYWNVMKNIANFWLWFYFIYVIFKWLIKQGKEEIVKNIRYKILWIIIAWIGIQASWFITAAVVDVSTITLVAVWSLPSQLIAWNSNIQESVENSVYNYFNITDKKQVEEGLALELFPEDMKSSEFLKTSFYTLSSTWEQLTKEKFFDLLLPNPEDVSWPLSFIGFSILRTNKINSFDSSSISTIKGALFNLIIQWWTTIIYSIEMAVLCVLALMRLLYLWMFIVLSPIAVLLWCIKMSKDEDVMKWSFIDTLMKQINIKSFLINVFKPTIIVLWLWLAMIFASLMNGVINKHDKPIEKVDVWWITVETRQNSVPNSKATDLNYTTSIEGGIIKATFTNIAKSILEFILCIITVILVYIIIKIAVKMWGDNTDFVSKKSWKVQDAAGDVLKSTPVVPVKWYDKETWAPTTHFISAGNVWKIPDTIMDKFGWKVRDEYNRQNQIIDSWFGKGNALFKSEDQRMVEEATTGKHWLGILTAQISKIRELGNRPEDWLKSWEGYGMVLDPGASNKWWQGRFQAWLTDMKDNIGYLSWQKDEKIWSNMINWWKEAWDTERTLENLFKRNGSGETKSVRAYAELFGLSLDSNDWNHLKEADFSRKP